MEAAGDNRWGHRDATAILIAYRHGLRASELVALRWDDIDFQTGKLHVRRAKGGTASVHPIGGRELRALRRLKREAPASIYVFVSERLAPLSVAGYQRMVARAGEAAGFPFLVHSHMLRHSCGYKLANDGQDTRAIHITLGTSRLTQQYVTRLWRLIASKASGRTKSPHYPARWDGSPHCARAEEPTTGLRRNRIFKLADQSSHKSMDTLSGYVRMRRCFRIILVRASCSKPLLI